MQFIDSKLVAGAMRCYAKVAAATKCYDFVQCFLGVGSSVVYLRQGISCKLLYTIKDIDFQKLACRVATLYTEHKCAEIFVDLAGVGAGVFDYLYNHGYPAQGVGFAGKASEGVYFNKRAELWGRLREWLRCGGALPVSEELRTDLTVIEFEYDVYTRIKLECKESIKRRGYAPPDHGDALALTFF